MTYSVEGHVYIHIFLVPLPSFLSCTQPTIRVHSNYEIMTQFFGLSHGVSMSIMNDVKTAGKVNSKNMLNVDIDNVPFRRKKVYT